MLTVRTFQLSDYSLVTRVMEKALSEECYEQTMTAFARQLAWDSQLVLIAESDGAVQGVIIGTIDNENAYYYRVAVLPEQRGKGIAPMLIEKLRARFEQRKVKRILVGLDAYNEAMVPLFEKAGYAAEQFTRAVSRLHIVAG